MGLAVVQTRASVGLQAPLVSVEVHLANGIPGFHIVGMAETTVKEARDRVRGAMINSGFEFPAKRITVNLAPADLPKIGGRYDLPIALGILLASEQMPEDCLNQVEVFGELALGGQLRGVAGALPIAAACLKAGHRLLMPSDNVKDLSLVAGLECFPFTTLYDVYLHLNKSKPIKASVAQIVSDSSEVRPPYWCDIIGQEHAKRSLLIAATGQHHLLFVGPPGTGKSLLANKLVQLLPPLNAQEALQVASIQSISGQTQHNGHWSARPFRQPHHTASSVALTGGGSHPKPGEVSLAHKGVLFLDELPEFGRHTLDVLREPLETGDINIARANAKASFPAQFQLIAAMNPSPTGDVMDGRSSPEQILRYLNRLSGPLLDRIDLQVEVPKLDDFHFGQSAHRSTISAEQGAKLVAQARKLQIQRQGCLNAQIPLRELEAVCALSRRNSDFIQHVAKELALSLRVFHRCLKVARSIADIAQSSTVEREHLAEAISYRALDNLVREFSSHIK